MPMPTAAEAFPEVPPEALAGKTRSGRVSVSHTAETLARCNAEGAVANVEIFYTTSVHEDEDAPREHVLLVHGTGLSAEAWRLAPGNVWLRLREKGYRVTAVDMRGHGRSTVAPGKQSVELLGADVAAAMASAHPGARFHLLGLSVGFGACMAIALNNPEMVKTLSGSGFLFNRTRRDFAAWIFSRDFVIRTLGLRNISWLGVAVMQVEQSTRAIVQSQLEQCPLEGYIATSSSWLKFDMTPRLKDLEPPTLVMLPERDAVIGHTRALYEEELALAPPGRCKLVEFPGFSHAMPLEPGGPAKYVEAVHEHIQAACEAQSKLSSG